MIWATAFCLILGFSVVGLIIFMWRYVTLRRVRKAEEDLPEVLHGISAVVKKGYSIEYAIKEMYVNGPKSVKPYFKRVLKEVKDGLSVSEALVKALKDFKESRSFSFSMSLIAKGIEQGSPIADLLDFLATSNRWLVSLNRERRKRALGIAAMNLTLTPLMLAILSVVLVSMRTESTLLFFFTELFKLYGLIAGIAAFSLSYFASGMNKDVLLLFPLGALLGFAPVYLVIG